MKIIRYIDSSDNIQYGEEREDSIYRIEGDLFDDFSTTDEKADVVTLLAPVQPEIILCIGLNYKFHAE